MTYDGNKKRRGRKQCLAVDTLGLIHAVDLLPAGRPDRVAGMRLLEQIGSQRNPRLSAILADKGFESPLLHARVAELEATLHIGAMPKLPALPAVADGINAGFRVIPLRWHIEQTNAWLSSCRRLNREHQRTTASRATFVWIAAARIALKRVAAEP
jgi:putative transposase